MMTTQEYRRRLKAAHMCRDCKKQDAYTLAGRTYCAECAGRIAAANRARRATPEGRQAAREAQKRLREKRTGAGLCQYCGKRAAMPGRVTCKLCNLRGSATRRARNIEAGMNWPRGANGICFQCNKNPVMPGRTLCAGCYAGKVKVCEALNAGLDRAGHPWAKTWKVT